LQRREALYRTGLPPLDVRGRDVIVVDDGLATGMTMRAAVRALRGLHARRIVVAVPTAARSSCASLREETDEVVCASAPEPFTAVGLWYRHFEQTSDEEVQALLERAHAPAWDNREDD
jgi:predicted phosphoribosyltransferase